MKARVSVAITGGIGSGKSTVLKILKGLGYTVFSCDEISKNLSEEKDYLEELEKLFPNVLNKDGRLNKKELSDRVFKTQKELEKLNKFSHPIIMRKLQEKINESNGVIFSEVPLLFEGGFENIFDFVIVVLRSHSKRVESVCARDYKNVDEIEARIQKQFDYENFEFEKLPKNKYFIIFNDEKEEFLKDSVEKILSKINP